MTIEQANAAVAALAQKVNPRWQPTFRIAPKANWINDPNGLIYFAGRYHVFYQLHPYSPQWGLMHWGRHLHRLGDVGGRRRGARAIHRGR